MVNPWRVIYIASRQEKKVAELLEKSRVEFYLPLYKSLRFWKDRKKWVEMPLFNGYIFVSPSEIERDIILQIPGVVKYIRHNGKDAIVPSRQIELIKNFIEFGYNISDVAGDEQFEVGDIAEILDGPLKGSEAEIFYLGDESYILVVVEALTQSIKVKLPKEILKITRKKLNTEEVKPLW